MGDFRRRTSALLGVALVSGIALAGCSAGETDKASSQSAGGEAAAGLSAPQDAAKAPQQGTAADSPNLSVDQRSIIYTGSITIRVEDVNQAAARATAIVAGAGGFVGGDDRHISGGASDATMQLRVPAAKFQSVVDQLAKDLGHEERRSLSTQDVTEETVDLDARISVQQARVDSGRQLLAQAKSLTDLVMLEREVATRESDLASLQAKKRRLADLTALSTITVALLDPEASAVTSPSDNGFLSGLSGGWRALKASLAVLLTVLGALLPWLIALGLPAWAIFYLWRRYRRAHQPVARPALAGAGLSPFPPGPAYGVAALRPTSSPPASAPDAAIPGAEGHVPEAETAFPQPTPTAPAEAAQADAGAAEADLGDSPRATPSEGGNPRPEPPDER